MDCIDEDQSALVAACETGAALCTIVNIEGSYSRRLGAQLALTPDGALVGSLSDGCLERQLAADVKLCTIPMVKRYGQGSDTIDFRLPCGGGLDILLDPHPDKTSSKAALAALKERRPASLTLPQNPFLGERQYLPSLRIRAFGEDPELCTFAGLAQAGRIPCDLFTKSALSLGRRPAISPPDRWTAVVLLYHDHDWENAILSHALEGESFYIGAQGGANARVQRSARLASDGIFPSQIARIRGPVGANSSSREPRSLALSILSEIVAEYEALHPHA